MAADRPDSSAAGVAERLAVVQERIAAACARAHRSSAAVTLIAVSKRIPLIDVAAVCAAGHWELGENRIQEALPRQGELAALLGGQGLAADSLRWHFIGHLQRNKAGKAVGRFVLLHGIDSLRLAEKISQHATALDCKQRILIEINAAREEQKQGFDLSTSPETSAQIARIAALPQLEVAGLMGMARHGASESELHATFGALRELAEHARGATGLPLAELSMGMSDDYEIAIAEGATLVRVGSAIFGPRNY